MAKVHIIGAGPCGSIAALSAIQRGHDVVVSEEHDRAGIPVHCSGLFSREGLASLKKFISYKKTVLNAISGADIYFGGEPFQVRASGHVAYVCRRDEFDAGLADAASSAGARIAYGERTGGEFRADCIIGADGPHSAVAGHFGFPAISRYVCTMQASVKCNTAEYSGPSIIRMYLSSVKFPGFFGWLIPHSEDTAEFGVGVALPASVRDAWGHLLRLHGIKEQPKASAAIIPAEARGRTALCHGKKKVLLVGDAAGQTKATTGGGIILGGNCAAIAGRHIENPLLYELEWRTRFGTDLLMHRIIRDYLSGLSDGQLAGLARHLKKMRLDDYLSRHGSMDRPTRLISPHALLHSLKVLGGLR